MYQKNTEMADAASGLTGVRHSAPEQPKPATTYTEGANAAVLERLPFANRQDFEDAQRGFMGTLDSGEICDTEGRVVWSLKTYAFLNEANAPATVNPSLWRQAQLNLVNGLFRVTEGIYQIRGFDISNMTIIEGDTGLIVIDPLTATETAHAGLELYYRHRPRRPVVAVIYTHSHGDHFAGVKGVINEADVEAGRVAVLAPNGFMEEAVSENVFAGNAMMRRAQYMYGGNLPKGATGHVDSGLGKATSYGTISLIAPTDLIIESGETRTIDGVEIEFQMAAGTEAPAEMLMFFPQWSALCTAEDATHVMHNLYTIRGAQVRDANLWWRALDDTLERYGWRADIQFAQHHWPKWGRENIIDFLRNQRDGYKFIHDQSLRLANHGFTPIEISERVKLPPSLASQWDLRDYYGTVNHNAKAVYQRYLGWYDANPANLYPLPPAEVAQHYVEYMGGAAMVIERARASFARGEYRWVAEVMKHVVFADSANQEARNLAADALEQLGYQAESATWRSAFLSGSYELRNGVRRNIVARNTADMQRAMTDAMFLDYLAIRLNGDRAAGHSIAINWIASDSQKRYALTVDNGVFHYKADTLHAAPKATMTMSRSVLMRVVADPTALPGEVDADHARLDGDEAVIVTWLGLLDKFDPFFNIVLP